MDIKNIGLKIKKVRLIRGLSTSELAQKAGVSQQYISLIENNKTTPSLKSLVKIAEALQISLSILIGDCNSNCMPLEYAANKELQDFLLDQDNVFYIKLAQKIKNSKINIEDIETIINIIKKYCKN